MRKKKQTEIAAQLNIALNSPLLKSTKPFQVGNLLHFWFSFCLWYKLCCKLRFLVPVLVLCQPMNFLFGLVDFRVRDVLLYDCLCFVWFRRQVLRYRCPLFPGGQTHFDIFYSMDVFNFIITFEQNSIL